MIRTWTMKRRLDERVAAGERAAPDGRREPRADHGHRQRDGVADRKPHARRAGRRAASSRRSPRGPRGASIVVPIQAFRSRGLRNAPVRKIRNRCMTIAAMKTIAAQWWVWRISSPAFHRYERSTVERYASRHRRPAQRRVRPVVDDVRVAGLEEERQVDAGRRRGRRSSRARSRRAGTTSGRGRRSRAPS